jgi:hypothetical protein
MAGMIHGNVFSVNVVDVTVDIGSVAANTTEEETFTLTGVKTGDMVFVSKPSLEAGLLFGSARVSAADTVAVQVGNLTASPINEASESLRVLVIRCDGESAGSALRN